MCLCRFRMSGSERDSDSGDFSPDEQEDEYIPDPDEMAMNRRDSDEPTTSRAKMNKKNEGPKLVLNCELTANNIQKWVAEGQLELVQPKSRGRHWQNGMRRLYWTDNREELKNWFICSICNWTHFLELKGGTGALSKHAASHSNTVMSMERDVVIKIIERASNNAIPHEYLIKNLPKDGKW